MIKMNKFQDFDLNRQLSEAIRKLGFTQPTEIQDKSIPLILKGKDVIGESATGSGKTLAFGCGIVDKVNPGEGLQALVLAPTRELAEQVNESLKELSSKLRTMTIYGGVSINPQIHNLVKADVVVATPGRLLDHINRRTIDISKIKILVLDEVDRMLDMGFIDDVKKIIKLCPGKRQTLFFSATVSHHITNLADSFMHNPVKVSAKRHVDHNKLKQEYYDVPTHLKMSLLVSLLKNEKPRLSMIFCNTRRTVDFVVKNLKNNGIEAIPIHGGLSQDKRSRTMTKFNDGKSHILVCTDVAARGLHIDNVSHIYNYNIPNDPKEYVHRIGRTARAGEEGKVINLLVPEEHENFGRVQREYPTFSVKKMKRPYLENIKIVQESRKPRKDFKRRGRRNRRF